MRRPCSFLLDARPGETAGIIPHLIKGAGNTLFGSDPGAVFAEVEGSAVLFVYRALPGDQALAIGDDIVLYPRTTTRVTTGCSAAVMNGIPVVLISLERYGSAEDEA